MNCATTSRFLFFFIVFLCCGVSVCKRRNKLRDYEPVFCFYRFFSGVKYWCVRDAMNCATTSRFFVNEKRLFRKAINRLTTNLNFASPIPFHNSLWGVFARGLAAIQSQNAFHTNVNLNSSSPWVFGCSCVLWDCSGCSLRLCSNVCHCESADR